MDATGSLGPVECGRYRSRFCKGADPSRELKLLHDSTELSL